MREWMAGSVTQQPVFLLVHVFFFFWCRGNLWCREYEVRGQMVKVRGEGESEDGSRLGNE